MNVQDRLKAHKLRSTWYWNLRNAGFSNIDAENFIAERINWSVSDHSYKELVRL